MYATSENTEIRASAILAISMKRDGGDRTGERRRGRGRGRERAGEERGRERERERGRSILLVSSFCSPLTFCFQVT